ncbi:PBECR2 nuclease fold domain-containing protein [Terasakiella sp. A23]|uniref:PBECR2 nuclease fold domain-containing protein n=1 Tax=Terasakiella sp. FCG-A23 TaxID=3080561 RepID=UPI002955A2DB|nr:PBECR2 nuclease fold domain-containing protein [Terasakiella sp. A23]MDV7340981.1 PBECR2 nuclease fold domain-containing protein [Terasakiella sp. A23]
MSVTAEPVAFKEAIDYFRQKVNLPTDAWTDVWEETHTKAFVVAGANKAAIVEDFRSAIFKAVSDGTSLEEFRKDFDKIVDDHGWSYKGKRGWRTRVIYHTNLRSSYMAGKWAQIERVKALRPYLIYDAVNDGKTRPKHREWDGLVYPVDHQFWVIHFPSNGFFCRCTVRSLSARDVKQMGLSVSSAMPPDPMVYHSIQTPHGMMEVQTPAGIDPGFAFNVGKNRLTGVTPPPAPKGKPKGGNGPSATKPMPKPRFVTSERLLPEKGMSEEDYAKAFLKEFGADIGKPALFKDKVGEGLPLSEELFKQMDGSWKITKAGREPYLKYLAENIMDPDEIWFDWEHLATGQWRLRRRYITRFDMEGKQLSGLSVFEVMRDGWREVTTFVPRTGKKADAQDKYLEKQRKGKLVYRKK